MARRFTVTSLLAAASFLVVARAGAQTTTFYLDRLLIAGAPEDGLAVFRPHIGPTRLYGQLALGYAAKSLRADNLTRDPNIIRALEGPPVDLQLNAYITLGAEILERGAVQVTLPITVFQRGYSIDDAAAGLNQAVSLVPTAPGDLRIDGRVVLAESDARRFKLGARAAIFLPTGDERSFTGDIGPWGNLALAAEADLDRIFVTLNAGASMRPKVRLNELTVGSEFTYGLAAHLPLARGRVRLGAELFGSIGLLRETLDNPAAAPLEWSVQSRMLMNSKRTLWLGLGAGTRITGGYAPNFRGVAWFGGWFDPIDPGPVVQDVSAPLGGPPKPDPDADHDGLPDLIDMCPTAMEDNIQPEDGCPEPSDLDKDGIVRAADRCPDKAEDKDGIDDTDGCPEDDADQDGFLDAADKCPKAPGGRGEDPQTLGCPQFIRKADREVQILKQIDFEFGRNKVDPKSYPVLDEIVQLLRANPEIKLLRVEGYTDNVGPAEVNETLSRERANAVREYVINEGGIDPKRVTSAGFGARKPIAPNDTAEGRAKNRRVEIHIITQAP